MSTDLASWITHASLHASYMIMIAWGLRYRGPREECLHAWPVSVPFLPFSPTLSLSLLLHREGCTGENDLHLINNHNKSQHRAPGPAPRVAATAQYCCDAGSKTGKIQNPFQRWYLLVRSLRVGSALPREKEGERKKKPSPERAENQRAILSLIE